MAGAQVTIMANQVEAQRLGYQAISLTNYDDTSEPQIAAGSVVEIGDALFEFSSLESITGWSGISNNSDVYIKLTVSGASVTASFTITAPTWDTAKQGWYSGAERYVFYLRKDGSGNYTKKRLLLPFSTQQSKQLTVNQLTVSDGWELPYFHVQEQRAAGIHAGTFTSGSWQTRPLSTVIANTIPGASLAANQITLPPGTYQVEAWGLAYEVVNHKAKLRRITATAADLVIGSSEYCTNGAASTRSIVSGRFVADVSIVIELQHYCSSTKTNDGMGTASNFGVIEVYTDVKIWRIA